MLHVMDITKVRDRVSNCQRNTEKLWYSQCYDPEELGSEQVVHRCSGCKEFVDCGMQGFDLRSSVRGKLHNER